MESNRGKSGMAVGIFTVAVGVGLLLLGWWFIGMVRDGRDQGKEERDKAVAQCREWADKLDRQTTETGVYIRWQKETLPDQDPWGHELRVEYSQGGVAESLAVRSLGPDGRSHTNDDIVEHRHAVNLKGVGTGIKNNAEETARNAGKGLVKGVIEGGREAIRGEKDK